MPSLPIEVHAVLFVGTPVRFGMGQEEVGGPQNHGSKPPAVGAPGMSFSGIILG